MCVGEEISTCARARDGVACVREGERGRERERERDREGGGGGKGGESHLLEECLHIRAREHSSACQPRTGLSFRLRLRFRFWLG